MFNKSGQIMSFHPLQGPFSRQCLQQENEDIVTIARYNHLRSDLCYSSEKMRHGAQRAPPCTKSTRVTAPTCREHCYRMSIVRHTCFFRSTTVTLWDLLDMTPACNVGPIEPIRYSPNTIAMIPINILVNTTKHMPRRNQGRSGNPNKPITTRRKETKK
jgi:hypothetical protein